KVLRRNCQCMDSTRQLRIFERSEGTTIVLEVRELLDLCSIQANCDRLDFDIIRDFEIDRQWSNIFLNTDLRSFDGKLDLDGRRVVIRSRINPCNRIDTLVTCKRSDGNCS